MAWACLFGGKPIFLFSKGGVEYARQKEQGQKTYFRLCFGRTSQNAYGINVLSQYMSFGEKYGEISGKSKAEVIDLLWKGLNSAEPGKQMGVALHIADYIIQNSVLESIYSDDDVQIQSAIDIVDALRPYLHSINLDSLKGEIKYRYDKDNSAYLLWGKRKGDKGIGVDTIPQILEEQGIYIDATSEADIFFEIDAQYRNAVKSLKKKAKDMLFESLSKEQVTISYI